MRREKMYEFMIFIFGATMFYTLTALWWMVYNNIKNKGAKK